MPISFPGNPAVGQVYTKGAASYKFDGKRWVPVLRNLVLTGNTITLGTATITSANGIVNLPAGSTIGGVPIGGGTLSALSDVQITGTPAAGQVLKWNGAKWAPGTDVSGGGGGSTLPGYINNYFLRDQFVGTGSQTQFGLSGTPINQQQVQVYVDNAYQNNSAYVLSGSTITFTGAPSANAKVEVISFITNTTSIFIRDLFSEVDGTQTTYNLTAQPAVPETTLVYVNGVNQDTTKWYVAGNVLTFNSPPVQGSNVEAIVFTTLVAGLGTIDNFADVDLSIAPAEGQALVFNSNSRKWRASNVGGSISVSRISGGTISNTVTNVTSIRFDSGGFTISDLGSGAVRVNNLGGTGGGTGGIIKTYNILNDFSAPLIGTQVFVPISQSIIRSAQITNGTVASVDIMLGLYRNNDFLAFLTLPTGRQTTVVTGLDIAINTNDYITVNVVAGSGRNLSMTLLSV